MSQCPRQNRPYIPSLSPFRGKTSPFRDKDRKIYHRTSPYGSKTGIGIFEMIGGLIMAEQCGFIMTEDKKSFLSYE